MSTVKKIALSVIPLFLLLCFTFTETSFAATSTSKPRISFLLKDVNGASYKAMIYSSNEKSGIASYEGNDFTMVWAGANPGDKMFYGNYQIALQKSGSKVISKTGITLKNYTYNYSRGMIYKVTSKYKGQPDLLVVSSAESSNDNSGNVYYVKSGKLVKSKGELWYNLRPRVVGKNQYQIANYYNGDGTWYLTTMQFNPSLGTFKTLKNQKYSSQKGNSIAKSWYK